MHAAFGSDPASSGNPQPPANLLDRVLYLYAVAVGVNFLAVLSGGDEAGGDVTPVPP